MRWATLNGRPLDLGTVARGRIPLSDLAADNVAGGERRASPTPASAPGILRTVDPSDKLVYVWTSFEPDDAAPGLGLLRPARPQGAARVHGAARPSTWTVTSNCAPDSVDDAADGGRRWTFPDTPPLSTYVVVVNAGPFHEIREERGGHSLGLYCRQSLQASSSSATPRSCSTLTAQGLAFFGERFGQPFPQERYDQVFVPNMGGAMENWGCVTWTDTRAATAARPPTASERASPPCCCTRWRTCGSATW